MATPPDRIERLDWAERWIADGFRVLDLPGGFCTLDVDMSRAARLVELLRSRGVRTTFNHVIARAAALALARHPELHILVAGTRRLVAGRVDIGLSVSGDTFFAPVMVIEDAASKPLPLLADEVTRRVPEVRARAEKDLAGMRRLGWLIPFGWLRRVLLRWLMSMPWFRRRLSGTFQITCVSTCDLVTGLTFNTAACLGVGRVRDRVVAVDGQPAVRPTVTLSVSVDHAAWDGARLERFLGEVKRILEAGELEGECGE